MHVSSSSRHPRVRHTLRSARAFVPTVVALVAVDAGSSDAHAANHELSIVSLPATSSHSGPFGRARLLDANGDRRLDVVTTLGGVPVVIFSPSMSQTTFAITGCEAVDLAVWPSAEADDVLVSTSTGVTRYRYGDTLGGGRPGYQATPLVGAAFSNSTSLAVVDLDGDGDLDLAALSDGGRSVLRAYSDPSGALTLAAPLPLGAAASKLVVVPWGTGLGYALSCGNGLCVLDGLGATLDGFVFSGPIVDVVPIREGAAPTRALAVLTNFNGGASRVTVVRAGGLLEAALELGAIEAFALHAADIDDSGYEDLVVTGRADGFLRVAFHRGAASAAYSSQAVSSVEVLDEALDPSAQGANALAADFDRDGDIDLFHLAEATRAGVMARETAVTHLEFAPELLGAFIEYGGPTPHAVVDVHARPLLSGTVPTQVGVELWAELAGGPTFFGGQQLSFPVGRALVDVDPLDPVFVVRIDSHRPLGERAWILLRGFDAGGTSLEVGTDDVHEFHRAEVQPEGGGGGSTTGGHNGDATTPPPKHIPPVGSGS